MCNSFMYLDALFSFFLVLNHRRIFDYGPDVMETHE